MTETVGTTAASDTLTSPTPDAGADPTSTRDVAKDEARDVAQQAAAAGKEAAETAKQQASEVANEAKTQAKALLDQTREELSSQGSAQQARAADGLHSLADEFESMRAGSTTSGIAGDLAGQAATQVRSAARWLEDREPRDVLGEVRSFARQRPGAFLLTAAAVGFVGGRVTRGITASSNSTSAAPDAPSPGPVPVNELAAQPAVSPATQAPSPTTATPPAPAVGDPLLRRTGFGEMPTGNDAEAQGEVTR